MRTYPFFCLLLALLAFLRVIIDRRRCEKRFVAVESLNITLEEVLCGVVFYALVFAL